MHDPFGYYARKAAREAQLRQAAPYRIDDQVAIIPTYEELVTRLHGVGLGVDHEAGRSGSFLVFDLMTGHPCGQVHHAQKA